MNKKQDVLIIGGGLAGGICAKALLFRGYDVQVIERESQPGGLLKCINVNGYDLDQGPHFFFHSRNLQHIRQWIHQLVSTTDCNPFAWSLPNGLLHDHHDYPVTRQNAFCWPDSDRILNELMRIEKQNASGDLPPVANDFAKTVCSLVGEKFYKRYFEKYTHKFWGVPPEQLAGDWAPKKIHIADQREPFFGDNLAYRPKNGFSSFVEKLYEEVPVINDEVIGLETAGNKAITVRCRHRGALRAHQYVSTIRPDRLIGRSLLAVRSLMLVYAMLDDREDIFSSGRDVQWAYLPNDYTFTRVSDMKKCCLLGAEAPHVLCFEFPCDHNQSPDSNRLRDEVQSFLSGNTSGRRVNVNEWHQCWVPEAYPIPSLDNLTQVNEVTKALGCISNLHRTGRFGAFGFTWMADIITESLDIADKVADCIRSLPCDA